MSSLTSMTLFRTLVTRRAVVKNLCYNCVKNKEFVQYIACMIVTVCSNSTFLNIASHKFVLYYI